MSYSDFISRPSPRNRAGSPQLHRTPRMSNGEDTTMKTETTTPSGCSVAAGSALPWDTIETAPKDGSEIVLWCQSAQAMLSQCRWSARWPCWEVWDLNLAGEMAWINLEPYEIPTHWLKLTPPNTRDDRRRAPDSAQPNGA